MSWSCHQVWISSSVLCTSTRLIFRKHLFPSPDVVKILPAASSLKSTSSSLSLKNSQSRPMWIYTTSQGGTRIWMHMSMNLCWLLYPKTFSFSSLHVQNSASSSKSTSGSTFFLNISINTQVVGIQHCHLCTDSLPSHSITYFWNWCLLQCFLWLIFQYLPWIQKIFFHLHRS